MKSRGELCSPAGVHRTPLRIGKIFRSKQIISPDRLKTVGVHLI